MTKKALEAIAAGLWGALAISRREADPSTYRVHPPIDVDVKAVRARMGLSRTAFADRFGFTTASVRGWEQKRRRPEGHDRILLRIIEQEPEAVERALAN